MFAFNLKFAVLIAAAFPFQTDGIGEDWFLVAPPGVGASVEMPKVPAFKQQMLQPVQDMDEILVRSRSTVMNNGNTSLTFVYHDELRRPAGRIQINKVLEGAMTGATALVNGELITQKEIFMGSYKGRDFVYTCEVSDARMQKMHQLKIRTQLILVEHRLFSLNYISVMSEYDDRVAERFFKSFQLVKTPDDLPPEPRAGRARKLASEPADPDVPEAKASEPIRVEPVLPDDPQQPDAETKDDDQDS